MGWKNENNIFYLFSWSSPKGHDFFCGPFSIFGQTARMHWANFWLFCEKNLSPVPWDKNAGCCLLTNFVQAYETSKTPSSCLGAGQIFVRCEIWQMCTRNDLKKNVYEENLIFFFFSRTIWVGSLPKLFSHICAAMKRWRWKIRTSEYAAQSLHWHSRSSNCLCWSWTNSWTKKTRI